MASSNDKQGYYTKLYDDLKLFENGKKKIFKRDKNRDDLCLFLFNRKS